MDEGCDSEHVPVQFKFKHVESEKIGPSLVFLEKIFDPFDFLIF